MTTYDVNFVNVDGAIVFSHRVQCEALGYIENTPVDIFYPLLGHNTRVDCVLDSPYQEDKRALYRLRIGRL